MRVVRGRAPRVARVIALVLDVKHVNAGRVVISECVWTVCAVCDTFVRVTLV